ncbi:cap-specific mRNA (nucleoside-2'-O-)-methyltransferase 1-like [Histomonas meleagridis]|uniref:cap-specific mRNA (nucleoside-2'-O-)-methyltransferase 1-like n=1 Tax=Histomonas meleagridis TaxID=135588 RepID=UPI00355AC6A4|nr:cap-specific mRNA (nucleoside-2'-O-)-methyltransferase 1-like [Histomonas meleagridis]KAH0805315.1 cap-specific mRNA (nucleoside-2'-O-)-methyltransferase 1-like [Histomonas meleagridis]
MPCEAYWKEYSLYLTKFRKNPKTIPFKLYSDEDPFYVSTPLVSPYHNEYPTKEYWLTYQKLEEMKNSCSREPSYVRPKFSIGIQILMNLGGRENPEFMAQQDIYEIPKDIADGSGIAYVLSDELKKLTPEIKRRPRFVPHEQTPDIIPCEPANTEDITLDNITTGEARTDLGHSNFCDQKLIQTLFKKKELFQSISEVVFEQARRKANPYEKIGKAIFMNRAAVKMANIDELFNLTGQECFNKPSNTDVPEDKLFYFADICAGPGGFTDYLYWRLQDRARGFGMTLAGDHDWASNARFCSDVSSFVRCYGEEGDGNIFKPSNLISFQEEIGKQTNGEMVSLVTGDGGIAVDGQENDQEMLLKRLVLCQFLCALLILRKGGNFVCKVFDCFTDFSVSLLYVVAQCFERFCIVKPYTSRPANSERYVVFLGLRESQPNSVIRLLSYTNDLFQKLESTPGNNEDIMAIFPISKIPKYFADYMTKSNEDLVLKQTDGVDEFIIYASDEKIEPLDQDDIANRCLKQWCVPRNKMEDRPRIPYRKFDRVQQPQEMPKITTYIRQDKADEESNRRQRELDEIEKASKKNTQLGTIIEKFFAREERMIVRPLFQQRSVMNESETYFSFFE